MSIARGILGRRDPVIEPIEDFNSKYIVSSSFFGDIVEPWDSDFVMDEFKYEDVSYNKCEAKLARNICDKLVGCSDNEIDYFCICVPCYNEDLDELETTLLSLMENFEFLKRKTRFYGDAEGLRLQKKIDQLVPVIVPIFDGMKAIHPTMRSWLDIYFEGLTRGLDGNSSEGLVDVRVGLRSWWYGFRDFNSELLTAGSTGPGKFVSSLHANIESQRLQTTYRQPLQLIANDDVRYSLKFPPGMMGFELVPTATMNGKRMGAKVASLKLCADCRSRYTASEQEMLEFTMSRGDVVLSVASLNVESHDFQGIIDMLKRLRSQYRTIVFKRCGMRPGSSSLYNSLRSYENPKISLGLQLGLTPHTALNSSTVSDGEFKPIKKSSQQPATPVPSTPNPQLVEAGLCLRERAPSKDGLSVSPATLLKPAAPRVKVSTSAKGAVTSCIGSSSLTDTSSFDSEEESTASAADSGAGGPEHRYMLQHDPLNRAASKSDSSKEVSKSTTLVAEKSESRTTNPSSAFTPPRASLSPTAGGQQQTGSSDESRAPATGLKFLVAPIVKRSNHRKHNSHQWFFNSICEGLGERVTLTFLTDCGTVYKPNCLSMLTHDLLSQPDLIGSTARQRVAIPNEYFHPCEEAELHFLRGDHSRSGDATPCWKCYATYFFSPAPLQGFEFEASLIANSAIFNIVEVMPVMPGPCQILNWKQMRRYNVVREYFDLLFNEEENNSFEPQPADQRSSSSHYRSKDDFTKEISLDNIVASRSSESQYAHPTVVVMDRPTGAVLSGMSPPLPSPPQVHTHAAAAGIQQSAAPKAQTLSFTEFVRVNMRLAEDRILSFVSVFCTGLGTKWVTGATFFYRPEIKFQTLLTQRRRWINGTFASFLFFFLSNRASTKVHGKLASSYKFRAVQFLYGLQLTQMLLVMIAPAVFASASAIGLRECGSDNVGVSIWLCFYVIVYVAWTISSFYAERGLMNEKLCWFMALMGFIFVMPIYISLGISMATTGLNLIHGLVLMSLFAPVFVAVFESITCAVLYMLYLPWFLVLLVFFLVYMPQYSFARLFDTTWGNRATGRDAELQDAQLETMKTWTSCFMIFLITLNVILAFVIPQYLTDTVDVLVCMFILLTPTIISLLGAVVYLLVVVPLRMVFATQESAVATNRSAEKLIMKSSAYMPQSAPLRR